MSIAVRVESGGGHQLLLAAAAVADPRWRLVFTRASVLAADWQRDRGRPFLTEVAGLGRFGWVHLAGRAVQEGAGGSRDDLLGLVRGLDAVDLKATLMGADRCQLGDALGEDARPVVTAAAGGDRAATARLRRALAGGRTSLEVHRWLWEAEPGAVRDRLLDLLVRLPDQGPGPDPGPMEKLLAAHGFEGALAAVAPRLHYRPGALDRVVMVASEAVDPVIVEIDLPQVTVIAHPPPRATATRDPAERLRVVARAAGDDVRMAILTELRGSERTLPELVTSLGRPRTTLLHHLALLRGAGLIDVEVPPRGPNSYRLDEAGFEEFASALRSFVARP